MPAAILQLTYPAFGFYLALAAWSAALFLGSLGVGRWLLFRLGFRPGSGRTAWILGLGLGAAALSYLVFTLACLRLLSPAVLAGTAGLWLAGSALNLFLPDGPRLRLKELAPRSAFSWILCGLIVLWAALNLVVALTPAVDWDGLAYHLALPKIYLAQGGFVFRPDIFHNLFPQFAEMFYLLAQVFPFGIAAKLVHWGFGLLAAAAVWAAGREVGWRRAAWLAAGIFYAQYLVQIESGTAFVDLFSAAYAALAFLSFLQAARPGAPARWWYLSLFFLGVCAAVKWHGLLLLAPATVLVALHLARDPLATAAQKILRPARAMFWAILPVLPYAFRAWILGGNPFWPLGYGFFGGKNWDAGAAGRMADLVRHFAGVNWSWSGLATLPRDLLLSGGSFGVGGAELRWPLAGLLILAVAWTAASVRGRGPARLPSLGTGPMPARVGPAPASGNAGLWGVFGITLFYLVAWFFTSPQIRFALVLFPFAAWLAAKALRDLWPAAARPVKIILVLAGLLLFMVHPPVHRDTPLQIGTATGRVPAGKYLQQNLKVYAACRYLNAQVRGDERVLLFGENRGFYLDVPYLWGDPNQQRVVNYAALGRPASLAARLRDLDVVWILFRRDLYPASYLGPETLRLMEAYVEEYGTRVFAFGGVAVFRLRPPGPEPAPAGPQGDRNRLRPARAEKKPDILSRGRQISL